MSLRVNIAVLSLRMFAYNNDKPGIALRVFPGPDPYDASFPPLDYSFSGVIFNIVLLSSLDNGNRS